MYHCCPGKVLNTLKVNINDNLVYLLSYIAVYIKNDI
jgi:hypothetical protein